LTKDLCSGTPSKSVPSHPLIGHLPIGYTMADKYKRTAHTMASPSQIGKATAKSNIQAGKPKAAGKGVVPTTVRQVQNKGVKDGTVRLGAGGKYYNVYDAKSGTWKRAAAAPAKSTAKPKSVSDYSKPKPKNIPYAGTRKPSGKEVGPGVLGVKAPKDGQVYRFGPPNDQSIYKWNASTKRFSYVSKHTPGK
jgi:hypothetical protein